MGLTGFILSGGESSRMGKDKGLVKFNGKYLVEYGLEVLILLCDNVFICTDNKEYGIFNIPLLPDKYPNLGPLSGIYTALENSKTNGNLFLPCDMPYLSKQTIEKLVPKENPEISRVLCNIDGFRIPVTAYYHKKILPKIAHQISQEKYKLQDLLDNIDVTVIYTSSENELRNINYFSDII